MLEDGQLSFAMTGTHRQIRLQDALAFKAALEARRSAQLEKLTRLSAELGGYSELD